MYELKHMQGRLWPMLNVIKHKIFCYSKLINQDCCGRSPSESLVARGPWARALSDPGPFSQWMWYGILSFSMWFLWIPHISGLNPNVEAERDWSEIINALVRAAKEEKLLWACWVNGRSCFQLLYLSAVLLCLLASKCLQAPLPSLGKASLA